MKLFLRRQKVNIGLQSNSKENKRKISIPLLIITFFIIAPIECLVLYPDKLWPGGFGFEAEDSLVNKSIETTTKGANGNLIKTTETNKIDDGKTLWDWLSLLGVPASLALLGIWFQWNQQNRAESFAREQGKRDKKIAKEQHKRDQKIANEQRERDQKIANEQRERDQKIADAQRELANEETKEEVLQVYFDRLSKLLVDKNLIAVSVKINSQKLENLPTISEEEELLHSAINVIRARTLSILRRFKYDSKRKTDVIQFLIEADFISKLDLDLSSADLSDADLRYANLRYANLSGVNLSGADIKYTYFTNANLSNADLSNADLTNANLSFAYLNFAKLTNANLSFAYLNFAKLIDASLSNADLSGADLIEVNLSSASLTGANLSGANLSNANLSNANLSGADLSGVDLSGANLSGADLSGANLSGADLTGIKNLSDKQITASKNWKSALYDGKPLNDPEVMKKFGLEALSD